MNTSEVQIRRALSAALRKLNPGATFSVDVRTMSAQPATDQTIGRRSCSLQHTIDFILEQFESEEDANGEVILKRA